MLVNNTYVQLPDEYKDYEKGPSGAFSESEFINNLMLNPAKYREFKRNINRINNIDNEINYIKSQEQKNQIDFVNNINMTEEEYKNAMENAKILFDNLSEIQIFDLLSHRKLLSNEKHLVEAMAYFLGIENLDWNTFKLTFNLYEAKQKMKNIDYSKIRKKKINVLLSQLCRGDSIENFLSANDFGDSGMEFVYEWVKCQMKIYFYLYQNKLIKKKTKNNNTNTNFTSKNFYNPQKKKNNKANTQKVFAMNGYKNYDFPSPDLKLIKKLEIGGRTDSNFHKKTSSVNSTARSNNFMKSKIPFNYTVGSPKSTKFTNKEELLMTALPFSSTSSPKNEYHDSYPMLSTKKSKIFIPVEAQKVNIKLKGYNVHKDKILREIRTAEMLPFLKNKTYHQMRDFFDSKVPLNADIEKKHRKDVITYSLTGKKNEKKLISLIASGKT
jgi:hypothetical protein